MKREIDRAMPQTPIVKQPRKTRANGVAREDILAAATDLFADRGFAAVTLREIAQRAGVHLPAIYTNFADKRTLYVACCVKVATQPNIEVAAALDDRVSDEENILAFATAIARLNIGNATLTKLAQRQVLDRDDTLVDILLQAAMASYYNRVLTIMRRLIDEDPDQRVFAVTALTFGAFQLSAFDIGAPGHGQILRGPETLARFVLEIVLPAIDWKRVAARRVRRVRGAG